MQDNKKDMMKSIIVLSVIAVISGILLSAVYQLTRITDEELNKRINAKLGVIHYAENGYEKIDYEDNDSITGFYRASGEDYYVVISKGRGYKGDLEMYVSFSGGNIVSLTPGSNSDTPGIREKALSEEYLKQYYVNIQNAVFNFAAGDFDAASGATYTSNGVLKAVSNAVAVYKDYLGGQR